VTNLSLQRCTVRDAEAYFIRLGEVRDFLISDIRFESPNLRPNQDGIHVGGLSENGIIQDLRGVGVSTNDDLVALSADDALQRAQNLDLKCGPVRNIRVENLKADSCHSFIRLLSVHNPITDIKIKNIEGGCRCMAINLDGCRECRVKLFDPTDPKYQNGVGDTTNLVIKNLRIHKSSIEDDTPLINLRTNLQDFVIQNFQRDVEKDLNPEAPTINFSDCRKSSITLDGITPQQVETIQLSECIRSKIAQKNAPGAMIYQGQFEINQCGFLRLMQNGFDTLTIQKAI
jgi:hypothetical protein